ncbi:hypothetical protein [Herbaspirillum sp. NPDC087042]|uniref:hypothetical protein n=1 Tax=Herbaspirillum sp. NPDC087042 TaxID=3364004 RepID=UPI003811986F
MTTVKRETCRMAEMGGQIKPIRPIGMMAAARQHRPSLVRTSLWIQAGDMATAASFLCPHCLTIFCTAT